MNHMNIEGRILQSLRPRRDGVLLRSDIRELGSPSQVSAALSSLQAKGLIQKVRHGVYAKPGLQAQLGEQAIIAAALERLRTFRKKRPKTRLTPTARRIWQMARREGIGFEPTYADRWAAAVTRLAGDEVTSDATDDLLVALRRAGKVSAREMASLLMAHHRERELV
jgi:hypothetical protein